MTAPARLRERIAALLRQVGPARWWFFPPVALGLLVTLITVALAPGVTRTDEAQPPLPVRVMIVHPQTVVPRLTAFGEIRSRDRWEAVAQVAGKVIWRHPELRAGMSFPAGTRLIEIEPLDYEVAESRADAQLRAAAAAEAEVDSRGEDLLKSIDIETRALAIARKRYQRNAELAEQGHVSQLQLDAEERELLRQEQNLQNLRTEANLLPSQLRAAEARVAEARAQLDKAQEDINRTVFVMPFAGRIAQMDAELEQFVPLGRTMVVAESIRDVELLLEVPYEQLVTRFPSVMADQAVMAGPGEALAATLRYRTQGGELVWGGRVSRIDPGLNASSRSAQVYVRVDLAEMDAAPATNLYVEVEIAGPALDDHVVIPRLAWHAGTVLVADADDRLRRREVTRAFVDGDRIVLRDGLREGERLILTDVIFPAEGMPVSPVSVDEAASL